MQVIELLRSSIRALARAPRFALTAGAILALGIGLSTAVFTVADALLLRRLPMRDQDRIVTLWGEKRDGSIANWPLDLRDTRQFARTARTLRDVGYVAYEGAWPIAIRDGSELTRLRRALVSGNYFMVLGTPPVLGRTLRPEDDVVGAAPVAVISYALWQHLFGGDPAVLERTLFAEEFGTRYRIVGVMPRGLEYPNGSDFWAPYVPARVGSETDTTAYTALDLVARLAPRASTVDAAHELSAFYTRRGASADSRELRGVAQPLPRVMLGDARPALLIFGAAASLLLLIACMNVANLLLVRGLARGREMAVRAALGAPRSRVAAQLLSENAILALVGGVAGIGIAALVVKVFLAFAPDEIPLVGRVGLDAPALGAALMITTLAALFFGLAPALVLSRVDAAAEILRGGTRSSGSQAARRAGEALVGGQVALAVLLLSAAALIGQSLLNLEHADLEFDGSHLLVAELAIPYDQYNSTARLLPVTRALLSELRSTPGVRDVSPVVAMPFSGNGGWTGRGRTEDQSKEQAARNPMFNMEVVTPGYFRAFGIPVQRGRAFTDDDREGAPRVVVVSEGTARRYWPGQDPIGKRLIGGSKPDEAYTVIGVVPDTRYRDLRDALPSVYYAFDQSEFPFAPTTLAIRAAGSPAALVPTIRRVIDGTAPGIRVASAAPFESYMRGPLAQPRLNTFLLAVFAAAAAVLAAIGLFAVMSTMVRQRAHEIGIRMAIGATAAEILTMVMGRGLTIAGAGTAAGLIGALAVNRSLGSLLYGIGAGDTRTLIGVVGLLAVVALLATFGPARWSARVDPASALRSGE